MPVDAYNASIILQCLHTPIMLKIMPALFIHIPLSHNIIATIILYLSGTKWLSLTQHSMAYIQVWWKIHNNYICNMSPRASELKQALHCVLKVLQYHIFISQALLHTIMLSCIPVRSLWLRLTQFQYYD